MNPERLSFAAKMQSNNVSLLLLLVFSAVQALVLTPGPAARARAHVAPLGSLITMQNKGGVSFDNEYARHHHEFHLTLSRACASTRSPRPHVPRAA